MDGPARISGLEAMLKEAAEHPDAPVDRWNPPYCGDIGLAILRDGTWEYQGSPIRRPALIKLFARVLRRDADGRHYLVTPAEKVDVHVADSPFLAVELDVSGSERRQRLTFRTNVDDIVECGHSHPLRFVEEPATGGLKPYLLVRGRLWARVTRPIYLDLVELASLDTSSGDLGLWSNGACFRLVADAADW